MKNINCDKMIIAILKDDDFHQIVTELNEQGFYATILHSSGGFLKRPNATIMIGLNHAYLQEALQILRRHGERTEMSYQPSMSSVQTSQLAMPPVQIPVHRGGVVFFVLDVAQNERY